MGRLDRVLQILVWWQKQENQVRKDDTERLCERIYSNNYSLLIDLRWQERQKYSQTFEIHRPLIR